MSMHKQFQGGFFNCPSVEPDEVLFVNLYV